LDNVDQERLMKFLGHRIADKRVLRYVKRFLKAGVMENGALRASDKGTPQGGIVCPIHLQEQATSHLWLAMVNAWGPFD